MIHISRLTGIASWTFCCLDHLYNYYFSLPTLGYYHTMKRTYINSFFSISILCEYDIYLFFPIPHWICQGINFVFLCANPFGGRNFSDFIILWNKRNNFTFWLLIWFCTFWNLLHAFLTLQYWEVQSLHLPIESPMEDPNPMAGPMVDLIVGVPKYK